MLIPVRTEGRYRKQTEPETIDHAGGRDRVDRAVQILLDAGIIESFLQQHASDFSNGKEIVKQYGDKPILWIGLDRNEKDTDDDAGASFVSVSPRYNAYLILSALLRLFSVHVVFGICKTKNENCKR